MLKKLVWNLQLFGEGGEGGDGGATSAGESAVVQTTGEKVPAFIPEKAKKMYQKAMERMPKQEVAKPVRQEEPKADDKKETTKTDPQKMSYADLIKSDDYKEEHKAYMDKTIGERLKKYKNMETQYGQAKEILDMVAIKYGITPDDEHFLENLKKKAEEDDSYYETYAMEHDVSSQEARRIVTMERKLSQIESDKAEAERQAKAQEQIRVLRMNAQKTKAQFPDFDLEKELNDERFRRLCFTTGGDTTSAYMACHWNEILPNTVQMAAKQVKEQTVNAIASGQNRPVENGVQSSQASVIAQDFSKMNLKELREYAAMQRRKQK